MRNVKCQSSKVKWLMSNDKGTPARFTDTLHEHEHERYEHEPCEHGHETRTRTVSGMGFGQQALKN